VSVVHIVPQRLNPVSVRVDEGGDLETFGG
jgi:hypothetical protein